MQRDELIDYIKTHYHVAPEYLWEKFPHYAVFKHKASTKWFAIIMDIHENKLNKNADNKLIDIVDIKVPTEQVGSLRLKKDIYPAYHMNKEHWITIKLNSSHINDTEIKSLIEESYQLTL